MADKDMKQDIHPFELVAAKSKGLTPECVHIAVKLGVSPQAIEAAKQTKRREQQKIRREGR